jgi:hypothetical protein
MSTAPRPNYEGPSWELMTPQSRKLVAAAAGFTNVHQLDRIAKSPWANLYERERIAMFRVNWQVVIRRQERKK